LDGVDRIEPICSIISLESEKTVILLTFPSRCELGDIADPFSSGTSLKQIGRDLSRAFPVYPAITSVGICRKRI
jgi:hypothetical protein